MRLRALVLLLALAACDKTSPPPAATVPVAAPAPTPTPTPVPTPTPEPTPNPIAYIRVAFFGIKCGDSPGPPNTSRQLPVGCKGAVTATPKDSSDQEVPPEVHGPDIKWVLVDGAASVRVADVADQPFNKDLFGLRPGPFQLCATVKGVTGCLDGQVIP